MISGLAIKEDMKFGTSNPNSIVSNENKIYFFPVKFRFSAVFGNTTKIERQTPRNSESETMKNFVGT